MRKKIFIAITVIILLLLSFFGFLEYRQYSSYKIPIHADVQSIIKLNTDAFIRSFIKEYGFDFSRKIKSVSKEKPGETENTGIYLPGNIFIYTLNNKLPSTLFCTIPLSNVDDFKKFIDKRLGVLFSDSNRQSTGTGYENKLTILCSEEYAAIAYSDKKEEVLTILKHLITKTNLAPASNELVNRLKKDRSHIVCAFKDGSATIEFNGHEIVLYAGLTIPDDILIPTQSIKRRSDSSSYASLFLNMKPTVSVLKKMYSIKERSLETDSLLLYFDGYTDIQLSGLINQTDTITTYEYDDNFQKKEKRTATTVKAPEIEMAMQTDQRILNYLEKQKIVTADHKLDKEVFPLYQVSVNQSERMLYLNTGGQPEGKDKFDNSPNFMEINIDLRKLQPMLDSTSIKKYITGIKTMNLNGRKNGQSGISIDGSVQFESSALKTVIDLIKSL